MVEMGLLKAIAEEGRLDGAPPATPGKGNSNSERFSAVVEQAQEAAPQWTGVPVPVVLENGVARQAAEGEAHHGLVYKPRSPGMSDLAVREGDHCEVKVLVQAPEDVAAAVHQEKPRPRIGEQCPHGWVNWMLCDKCKGGR
jgi:hypothetical protein